MRRILLILAASALLVLALAVPAFSEPDEKVTICHNTDNNPHEITVSENAVPAHLKHGDILGACPDDDNDDGFD
jgi:hypothetical protein